MVTSTQVQKFKMSYITLQMDLVALNIGETSFPNFKKVTLLYITLNSIIFLMVKLHCYILYFVHFSHQETCSDTYWL